MFKVLGCLLNLNLNFLLISTVFKGDIRRFIECLDIFCEYKFFLLFVYLTLYLVDIYELGTKI